jgi:hypothetical protein
MSSERRKRLSQKQIEKLSSHYLNEGRKQESWTIKQIDIEDDRLIAEVSMTETYISATDEGGFHLTLFSTLEFLSQLMIIYTHVWAGLEEKSREGWMVESHARIRSAVRDPDAIHVEMQVKTIRKRGEKIYIITKSRVTDNFEGLFEMELKAFLS